MASHIEGSVSKGVFFFKGTKRSANPENYYGDNELGSDKRYELCDGLWQVIDDRVQILQSDLNTKIFEELLHFVKTAHGSGSTEKKKFLSEIPTAALITGVNSPDHAVMFSNLMTLLHNNVTPFVCQLKSKDCPNVKSIIGKTVSLLMESPTLLEDEEDDQPNMKRINPTFSVLSKWYEDKHKEKSPKKPLVSSPRKRKASGSPLKSPGGPKKSASRDACQPDKYPTRPPVVLVLQDLESFPAHVLQDFVTICSNHLQRLPVVLVLGIATSVTAVHRLLPHAASSLLSMEKFQAPPSSDYLTSVINQVLMTSDIPFKLGHRVFTFLLDLFLFHDFSVLNFTRGLQFALLDHFYSHPYTALCQEVTSAVQHLKNMSSEELQSVLELPSLQKYIEERQEEKPQLFTNEKKAKDELCQLIENLEDYHSCYFPVLKCLHVFASKLPKYPIGKQIREMYALNLGSTFAENPNYEEALILMKSLSRDEMLANLKVCQNNLHCDRVPTEFEDIQKQLQDFIDKFESIDELQKEADERQKEAEGEEVNLPKKTDIYTLRRRLQELEKKKKKLSIYEELRCSAIDFMDRVFNDYLIPPNVLPLHEIFYYDDLSVIRRTINGSPRATIQLALSDPQQYLQNEKLSAPEDGSISPELPDICIVFKLHLECGRMINLYDWLQAFVMIVTAGKEEPAKKSKGKKKSEEADKKTRVLQARFIRAVSELQFLGFIKPTKRKTDHVARLTWGGC